MKRLARRGLSDLTSSFPSYPDRPPKLEALADAALSDVVRRVLAAEASIWDLALGRGLSAQASIDDAWLVLDARLPPAALCDPTGVEWPTSLLIQNRSLPAFVKLALGEEETNGGVRIRAEVPLSDGRQPESDGSDHNVERARRACEGFLLAHRWGLERGSPVESEGSAECIAMADVAALCREGGWRSVEEAPEEVRVTLDADGFRQASLSAQGADLRLLFNLRDELPANVDPASRYAAHLLLLRTGSGVRLVRPCACGDEELGFEVRLSGPFWVGEIDAALGALSFAARMSAEEVGTLAAHPHLATAYLSSFALVR